MKRREKNEVDIGKMFVHDMENMFTPKYIINFPTKQHWKSKSRIEDIESGLKDLKRILKKFNIRSVAIPPLGSGLGGLSLSEVKSLIIRELSDIQDVEILLYEPKDFPQSDRMPIATPNPNMTRVKAPSIS